MRRSELLETTARGLFHMTLLISVWLTLRGHNNPGGGFAGGLVAATAFVMAYLARGAEPLRATVRVPPETLIGVGLALATLTGLVPMFTGGDFLGSDIAFIDIPLVGEVKFVTSVIFDMGVYLLVVGVVLLIITELGIELSEEEIDNTNQRSGDDR